MLIVFPLGVLATSVILDIIYLATKRASWTDASFHVIPIGVLGGLAAALFGFIDWLAIPGGTRAKSVGGWHGGGNVIVVALFAVSWWLRRSAPTDPSTAAITLSIIGVLIALVTGWLGGELVDRLGVGVDEGAHVDAPSSLSGAAASRAERPLSTAHR
jgi:uncharacterized membrane protein